MESKNKRIVVNTSILYVKFILNTIISFLTSRVVLEALGASDYGLYNVVGGVVVMLNTLGTCMIATSYRYMAIEIGRGESGNPNKVYNTVFCIHLFLAVLLLIVGETLGVFYVNNYLNVDSVKIPDALFVLHVSLLTTAFAVIAIPSNGLIIAREKFLFTSSVEIITAVIKLGFIVLLLYVGGNKLRLYAVFLAVCQLFIPVCYQIYCQINDSDVVKWCFNNNYSDYKGVFTFAWWILLGAIASIARIQGVAIIMNLFFGPIANAAFGLATQVNSAISQFTSTVQQATVPQIMKRQGGGELESSVSLVYVVSRFSFLMMLVIAVPIIFSINSILCMWLKEPPGYTNIFIVLLIINALISNLGAGIDASIQATGKIKINQIGFSVINLSIMPITYVLYKLECPVYSNVIVMIGLTLATLVFQLFLMTKLTVFNLKQYVRVTLCPSLNTLFMSCLLVIPLRLIFNCESIVNTFIFCCIAMLFSMLCVFSFGLSTRERSIIINYIISKRNYYEK